MLLPGCFNRIRRCNDRTWLIRGLVRAEVANEDWFEIRIFLREQEELAAQIIDCLRHPRILKFGDLLRELPGLLVNESDLPVEENEHHSGKNEQRNADAVEKITKAVIPLLQRLMA